MFGGREVAAAAKQTRAGCVENRAAAKRGTVSLTVLPRKTWCDEMNARSG